MTESSKQFATGGEENWQRMVRLLRDERCVGRADLMADAAKMIERLVGYLDNASAASEAKACPLCHGYSSEHCFVSVCPMKTETTPSETGELDLSEKARLADALDDVKRLHEEKMKFFERTIELERELAAAKRQACTSEHRTTCSFALSATPCSDDAKDA